MCIIKHNVNKAKSMQKDYVFYNYYFKLIVFKVRSLKQF
jgi:hypothetical protein